MEGRLSLQLGDTAQVEKVNEEQHNIEPRHVISNNVAVLTNTCLSGSLVL